MGKDRNYFSLSTFTALITGWGERRDPIRAVRNISAGQEASWWNALACLEAQCAQHAPDTPALNESFSETFLAKVMSLNPESMAKLAKVG